MIIKEGSSFVEILATERVPDHLPTPGDLLLAIRVKSNGFGGEGSAWVASAALTKFVAELQSLEKHRSGDADLESMSPGGFRLQPAAIDGWGHMAVSGRLEHQGQAIEFRFEVCPSLLPSLISEFVSLT